MKVSELQLFLTLCLLKLSQIIEVLYRFLLPFFVAFKTSLVACCWVFFFLYRDILAAWGAALKSERMNTTHTELSKVSQCQSGVKQHSGTVKALLFQEGP